MNKVVLLFVATAPLALLSASCTREPAVGRPSADEHQDLEQDAASRPQYQAYCDPDTPGVSVVEIRWNVSHRPLSERQLATFQREKAIDVTVHPDGFKRGFYGRAIPLRAGTRFTPTDALKAAKAGVPAVEGLRIAALATSRSPPRRGLLLHKQQKEGLELITVRIDGLEAGLYYSWRLPSERVDRIDLDTELSETCPVDRVPSEK